MLNCCDVAGEATALCIFRVYNPSIQNLNFPPSDVRQFATICGIDVTPFHWPVALLSYSKQVPQVVANKGNDDFMLMSQQSAANCRIMQKQLALQDHWANTLVCGHRAWQGQ